MDASREEASMVFDPGGEAPLKTGDYLLIPAHLRYRVDAVSCGAICLAIHFAA